MGNELTGIAFDAAGKLWAASSSGYIYAALPLSVPGTAPAPTLTSIVASSLDGNPAAGATAWANVGQAVELRGSGFTANTQVLFPTRDNNGATGTALVLPTAVSADGTRLQAIVPDLATTGPVTVNGFGALRPRLLQLRRFRLPRPVRRLHRRGRYARRLRFPTAGFQGFGDESWGIDNVHLVDVTDPAHPATVYSTDFEGGAGSEWWRR